MGEVTFKLEQMEDDEISIANSSSFINVEIPKFYFSEKTVSISVLLPDNILNYSIKLVFCIAKYYILRVFVQY